MQRVKLKKSIIVRRVCKGPQSSAGSEFKASIKSEYPFRKHCRSIHDAGAKNQFECKRKRDVQSICD
jgi:hypothetical protein